MFGKKGHTAIRNKALENLVAARFSDVSPTRLAFCNAPVTRESYGEAYDIYVYARQRNIYPVTAVLMTSGKQIDQEFLRAYDISDEQKVDLWTRIYAWNIDNGIQTVEQIREEGVSVLPGAHPCNQLAAGLYVTANGNVVGCPGFTEIEGNVKSESIGDIWEQSENRRLRCGEFNCKCPPKDGITIPTGFYDEVLRRLEGGYE